MVKRLVKEFKWIDKKQGSIKDDVFSGLTVALALVPEAVAFAFVVGISPIIGLYGAIRYPDASMADFLGQVLIHDQTGLIASLAIIGLFAAAMSTSDSQLFALGNELRGLISKKENESLKPIRLAIVIFAVAALVFSLLSSDQLVLLARVSFAGTAMMGPLVILGIFSRKPQGIFMIVASGLGILAFILSLAGVLPGTVGALRMDLFLMILLTASAGTNYLIR